MSDKPAEKNAAVEKEEEEEDEESEGHSLLANDPSNPEGKAPFYQCGTCPFKDRDIAVTKQHCKDNHIGAKILVVW